MQTKISLNYQFFIKGLVEELYQFNRCYFQTHDVEDATKKDSDVKNKMEETLKLLSLKEGNEPLLSIIN